MNIRACEQGFIRVLAVAITYSLHMDVFHIRTLLLYEFKQEQNAADTEMNINQAFVDDTVKERTYKNAFKNSDPVI